MGRCSVAYRGQPGAPIAESAMIDRPLWSRCGGTVFTLRVFKLRAAPGRARRSPGPGLRPAGARVLPVLLGLALGAMVWGLPAADGAPPAVATPGKAASATEPPTLPDFRRMVRDSLRAHGLREDRLSLLLFSTRDEAYLFRHDIHRPRVAASNAKLVTTYAALRVLTPDYRWRTRFYLVQEHHDAGGAPRQGLLVQGTGDPTLTGAHLRRIAVLIRAQGIARLDGGIYFDGRRFDDVIFPASWGDVSRAEPWFAPVSPFIVNRNVVEFFIATEAGGRSFKVLTAAPGYQVVSTLTATDAEDPRVRAEQSWEGDSATFTFHGSLRPARDAYPFEAAVERPRVNYYRQLRAALRAAGVEGEMPLRLEAPLPPRRRHLHTHRSPSLREVLVEVNKHSSNLTAEILLRTMGLYERKEGVSTADGLTVLRRVLAREFREAPTQAQLVDGSGLSRENRLSALFMVRLLNRVRGRFGMRPEFINSLSVALTDGTLQFRHFPWRMKGKLRGKTGTLSGVSNLSGYLDLPRDLVVFSFLINDPALHYTALQRAQDAVLTDIYDGLRALAAGRALPTPAATAVEPPDHAPWAR